MPPGDLGFVILSGPPASGKTTLGPALAHELRWPYFAKDEIKQVLLDEVGAGDLPASRRLGATAMQLLLHVAARAGCGVLDGTWLRERTPGAVGALPAPVVEVFCRCPQALLEERFASRAAARGAGHFDAERTWDELWGSQTAEPVAGGWPVIEVRTDGDVDVGALADQVRSQLLRPAARPAP